MSIAALKDSHFITEVGDWGSGWKGKAFQNESPGLSADSNVGRSFLKIGHGSGARGGSGEGPPSYQLRSARRDNPKGPEKANELYTLVEPEKKTDLDVKLIRGLKSK